MKNIVVLMCCIMPVLAKAQNKKINFQNFENWQQALAKAKAENKIVFIDAYATWCGPCKMMDKQVYTDSKVAEYVNANFIAIKVQMDQTKNDSASIKNWYMDASQLQKMYKIEALPTFLFLDAAGKQVYRGQGYQNTEAFFTLVQKANDPLESYFVKIDKFKKGKMSGQELLLLSIQAKKYHEDSLAFQVAVKYKKTVIDRVEPSKLLNPQLLDYFSNFGSLLNVNDSISQFMYLNPAIADSLLNRKGTSIGMINYLISKDILTPVLLKNGKIISEEPDWDDLEKKVAKSYGDKISNGLIVGYKIAWYQEKKDWENVVKYNIEKQDINEIDTTLMGKAGLNNLVYYIILKYTSNPVYLTKALEYMEIVLKNNQDDYASLDTYATVLYKLGKKGEALNAENRALYFAEKKKDEDMTKIFKETIQKMEHNLAVAVE